MTTVSMMDEISLYEYMKKLNLNVEQAKEAMLMYREMSDFHNKPKNYFKYEHEGDGGDLFE
jgi:hypothetical protein